MKTDLKFTAMLIGAFLGAGLATPAVAQEGVFLDPVTGDYTIRYRSYGNAVGEAIFYPHTKIDPVVKSKVKRASDGSIVYGYKVKNGEKSKQNLISLRVTSHQVIADSQNSPPGWSLRINPISSAHPIYGHVGNFVSWIYMNKLAPQGASPEGLAPGASQEYVFRSLYLPGAGIMSLRGDAPVTEFLDDGPDHTSPVGIALNKLEQNDFVPRFVAAPRIPVPAPFDAATVLAHIQKHLVDDLVPMKLVDPAFADRFHRLLDAAIDAAKRGNTAGLRAHLKDLRLVLKGFGEPGEANHAAKKDDDLPDDQINTKHWPHPVAKLAAQVLDFDLNYVEKKLK